MIDPDYFGCSSKLGFSETKLIADAVKKSSPGGDFSLIDTQPRLALSIDRISRCSSDWSVFANVALSHAENDVLCARAEPRYVLFAFEFGPDAGESDRLRAAHAFAQEAERRGLSLGKCHSAIGLGPTAVTITVIGDGAKPAVTAPNTGKIYISGPLGFSKLQYLAELGILDSVCCGQAASHRRSFVNACDWSLLSDVSGHGLAGSLLHIASDHILDITVNLTSANIAADEVVSVEAGCLLNTRSSFDRQSLACDDRAWAVAGLKETAGPIIGLLDDRMHDDLSIIMRNSINVGSFKLGTGKVNLSWKG